MNDKSRDQAKLLAEQIGSSLMDDNQQYINRFTISSKTSSREYIVSQRRSDGGWCCGCPGWRHYRKCKHLTEILRRLSDIRITGQYTPEIEFMINSARVAYLDLEPAAALQHETIATRRLDF
jgi:hypothetical protein